MELPTVNSKPVVLSAWVCAAVEPLHHDFADLVVSADNEALAMRIEPLLQDPEREALGLRLAELATGYSYIRQHEKLKVPFRSKPH